MIICFAFAMGTIEGVVQLPHVAVTDEAHGNEKVELALLLQQNSHTIEKTPAWSPINMDIR
jgi:hypothetical protein